MSGQKIASSVKVFFHPAALEHDTGPYHPESLMRAEALVRVFGNSGIQPVKPEKATDSDIIRAHDVAYAQDLSKLGSAGGGMLDPDTIMGRGSIEAIYHSAGAGIAAALSALDGCPAFSAMRPPGHHACAARAMGFCFFNNVVVAARAALEDSRVERVLIVDWDVHHGNGTQELVWDDARIRYVSLHQHPHYPGTGTADETGGCGNIFNVPRAPGLEPGRYVEDLLDAVGRACTDWRPDVLLVSAGFDSLAGDPLGGFTLQPEHFAVLTAELTRIGAPVASLLEGGYAPGRTAEAALAHIEALGGAGE